MPKLLIKMDRKNSLNPPKCDYCENIGHSAKYCKFKLHNVFCTYCKRKNHRMRDCIHRKNSDKRKQQTETEDSKHYRRDKISRDRSRQVDRKDDRRYHRRENSRDRDHSQDRHLIDDRTIEILDGLINAISKLNIESQQAPIQPKADTEIFVEILDD